MPLILEATYSKKIGLPGYSSHQFSLMLRTELHDPTQIQAESARLYDLLQGFVDDSLKHAGWLPGDKPALSNGNGSGHGPANGHGDPGNWNCSDKQRELITQLVAENRLDKNQLEQAALERFGKGVRQLNKQEASGLIDKLFERPRGNGAA